MISLSIIGSQGEVVTALGLNSIGVEQLTLADGSEITADLCPVTIIWQQPQNSTYKPLAG